MGGTAACTFCFLYKLLDFLTPTPIFFSFSLLLTFFPTERLWQVESIKTVHLSENCLSVYASVCVRFHNCAVRVFV